MSGDFGGFDPVEQMKLDEKKAAVDLDKLQQKARDWIEEKVRERLGKKGQVLPLEFYPQSTTLARICKAIPDGTLKLTLFKKLVTDMQFTMYLCGGVGLAAPQIGLSHRLFVADWSEKHDTPIVVANPEILWTSDESVRACEPCLSIPAAKPNVVRPSQIRVRFTTEASKQMELELEGWAARIFLHETDHLDGKLMIDHPSVGRLERRIALKTIGRIAKGEAKTGPKPRRKRKQRRR